MKRLLKFAGISIAVAVLLAVGGSMGASYYYTSQYGQGCASCHEMAGYVASFMHPHRTTNCMECHEAGLSTKLRHMWVHSFGQAPEGHPPARNGCAGHHRELPEVPPTRVRELARGAAQRHLRADFYRSNAQCKTHVDGRLLPLSWCVLRRLDARPCSPVSTKGPWRLLRPALATQPAMPCMSCHQVHSEGAQEARPAARISTTGPAVPDSIAFYDRREMLHFSAASLSIPQLFDGARAIKISPDPRQGLCYQCHAAREPEAGSVAAVNAWGPQAGSGDDRTPMGVHEGISCIACHDGHSENTTASCSLPSADVQLRTGRGEDRYHLCPRRQCAQHPLGEMHRLPSAWHSQGEDGRGYESPSCRQRRG